MTIEKKGQGSLEYLLIVGGAVAIAAIVVYLALTSSGKSNLNVEENERRVGIASDCRFNCLDLDQCTPYATKMACEADCKTQGYNNSEINAAGCTWNCSATPTAGDWRLRQSPGTSCSA